MQQLIFVDTRLPDHELLLEGISRGNADAEVVVYVLDADHDGIDQLSVALASHADIDAVHILSHGSTAGLQLGNTWLSTENLAGYSDALSGWRAYLSYSADVLLYGCDLAADQQGVALADAISVLTGADVAASTDPTGHATQGGDWDLEHRTGQIETAVIPTVSAQNTWHGLLGATPDPAEFLVNEVPGT